jgi:hypothetical protein
LYNEAGERKGGERVKTSLSSCILSHPMVKFFHSTEEEVESLIRLGEAILVLMPKQWGVWH